MARLTDTILESQAHSRDSTAPLVDLTLSGQNGHQLDYKGYVGNAAYVKPNLIAVLIEAPRGFQDLEEPDKWVSTLKSLIELHPQSIEGLTSTVNVEMSEVAIGGAGEMQESVANVTRERSVPVFTWSEKYNKPIKTFLEGWIYNLLMDADNKYPRVITSGSASPSDLLPDYQGMTVLFFEADPTFSSIIEAYLCTNMMPKTGGENTSSRDLTAAGEGVEYSVEFSSITQVGLGVKQFAQQILDTMNMTGVNPNLQPAFMDRIDSNVDSSASPTGYADRVKDAADSAITQ